MFFSNLFDSSRESRTNTDPAARSQETIFFKIDELTSNYKASIRSDTLVDRVFHRPRLEFSTDTRSLLEDANHIASVLGQEQSHHIGDHLVLGTTANKGRE